MKKSMGKSKKGKKKRRLSETEDIEDEDGLFWSRQMKKSMGKSKKGKKNVFNKG